ncbi:MAG TPA: PA domain-containing protein [Gaiellaceae bacterium]|nr:PA domain-containing protein [Gaiellaceae bacterium]
MNGRHKLTRLAVTAVGLFAVAGIATAASGGPDGGVTVADGARDAHQHGTNVGHLHPEGSQANVELVSKLKLKNAVPEKIADVGVHNGYAYLAAWGVVTCKYNGVHVVDVRDPAKPREVAFIPSKEGSYPGEGVQALRIDTPAFRGDILVTNNEKCKEPAGFGGMNIYDVSRPTAPTPLAEGVGDSNVPGQGKKDAHEIHSVFAWDAGDRAYAVIVDNEEGADVDIVDITNPKKPFFLVEYDLDERFPQIRQAAPENLVEVFLHDMVVKEIGGRQVMLLSYWDAGYVAIDVTDPLAPTYIGDTDFTNPDPEAAESGFVVAPEGNGHEAEFTLDNRYVVAADEDFGPTQADARNVTDGTALTAGPGSNTRPLPPGETIEGVSVFVGRACPGDPAVPAGNPAVTDVAVVERGVCLFTEKVASVIAAGGYDAVLIFNRTGTDGGCNGTLGMTVAGDIPTFGVAPRGQGFAIFDVPYDDAACLAGTGPARLPVEVGTTGDTLRFTSFFDGWGYVHLYRYGSGKMAELDTYAIPEAHDPAFASGFGDLSVHEAATSQTRADLVYFSYYAAGFRVAKIVADRLVEVGHHIDVGGNNFWGVQVFDSGGQEYVAASDRDLGLYIFRYTGS